MEHNSFYAQQQNASCVLAIV